METTQAHLNERALRLSYFTVGYNVLEGVASIVAGALAGSVALVGFGLDSFVESLSGSVMIWRFRRHDDLSPHDVERREQRAVKLISYTFYVLGAYVLYEAGRALYLAEAPDPSLAGIVITSLSLVLKPVLAVPVEGHFEQYCNSLDAATAGAGLASSHFDIDRLVRFVPSYRSPAPAFRRWVREGEARFVRAIEAAAAQAPALVTDPLAELATV